MTKKIALLRHFILFLSLFFVGGVQAAESPTESPKGVQITKLPNSKDKDKDNVILIQFATSGSIEKDKSNPNLYKISLRKVMPYLNYVADRPGKTVGKITLTKYLELWAPRGQNGFDKVPPNAIIHSTNPGANGSRDYFALEISKPQYDATTETLTYQGKALAGEGAEVPDNATFEHMTVIIDDVCIGCWN